MKFVVYGEDRRIGLLEKERILDLSRAAIACDLPGDMRDMLAGLQSLIESGQRGLDLVLTLAEKLRDSDKADLWVGISQVQLQAPWPGQRFLLAGSNNPAHLSHVFTNMGTPLTEEEAYENGRKGIPSGFWGESRPVMGPGDDIKIPRRANGYFDYEAEPAIILGKRGKDIKAERIADYVWGVTLVNDWSIRIPEWPQKPNPLFMPVKNFDYSKSIGPCIVVGEIDADDIIIETIVNGELRQKFSSSKMIYSFGEILEYFSQDFTYFPGDVVAGGTGPGTVIDQTIPNEDGSWPQERFLKPGDTVEIRSDVIGPLVNKIVA